MDFLQSHQDWMINMARILVVDDEAAIRRLLGEMLDMSGYKCALAADAADARTFIRDQGFDLILCDVNMPGESGLDLIRYVLAEHQETAVIMVSAVDDTDIAETALQIGAFGYIIKPFRHNELMINIANALRRRELEIKNRIQRENLEQAVLDRTGELQTTLNKLKIATEGIIQAMAMTIEIRDPYTAGHQRRVRDLSRAIAEDMGISKERINAIRMSSMIHDLGKIALPSEILSKPGLLTTSEFELIKTHSQIGYNILKDIEFPWPLAEIILQHHERMDGSGYPHGLSGEDILHEARIVAVADVVEAISSHRPYRPALGIDKALEEISINKNVLYDRTVVETCVKLFSDGRFEL
ncbi:MAG: two-component system response regulator [Deltaproteobacteria bacterium CG12_big_fil_rev_8_21_14_0_65_43_10]|nr:MAG: two-component system response regulator [Deltaproteobacteria bacterium CG12_big_fil_rev_8_21_14_0_65_43_10]PIU84980.1 MAG: two-component system response regulator [Deltaproteobacteria bacterium CG06_land_8_20_14_3_00_44_19]PIX24224.1 MAG: two-component system response regulator [Deltaproteobacteria bacterium CG_4_8_14_3_um_filter_43_13]PIZ18551.1 MAG: two-component system response regulator [Deltaproteobacteria bacterium CG_4_10_14_0_8_um_filter_43_12]PJB40008.1 MAG: two-component syste